MDTHNHARPDACNRNLRRHTGPNTIVCCKKLSSPDVHHLMMYQDIHPQTTFWMAQHQQ